MYEFDYKIVQPTLNFDLFDFSVEDWCDVNKLRELQAEANQHAVAKFKNFFHENNVFLKCFDCDVDDYFDYWFVIFMLLF